MSDDNLAAFWQRFEDAQPGAHLPLWELPHHLAALKHQSLAREAAGREQWGTAYLKRDNLHEATEELSDAVNYVSFFTEQCEAAGREAEWDLVMEFAAVMGRAYEILAELRHKAAGAP